MENLPTIIPEYASIETCTACNHQCLYCPVSLHPQKQTIMTMAMFVQILDELSSLKRHFKRISFNHYNEPLLDPYWIKRIAIALNYDFFDYILINTNLSILNQNQTNLIQPYSDRIEFNINLPTCLAAKYRKLKGVNDYKQVESNLKWLIEHHFRVKINSQTNRFTDYKDFRSVISKFGKQVKIDKIPSISRAGLVKLDRPKNIFTPKTKLVGCKINRPVRYLHIGVRGEVFFCCQDYFKKYRLGNLTSTSLKSILVSTETNRYLSYLYGFANPPEEFICNKCEFAVFG